jgi:hypothetical protein
MISQLKGFAKSRFPFLIPVWRQMRGKSPDQVFTEIYRINKWGDVSSASGPGSNLEQTETIRKILPLLIKELNCKSILDIPCGDFFWMKLVDLDVQYIGGDIVAGLINNNKRKYAGAKRKFVHMDLIHDRLPKVDLIICRDCLVHFPLLQTLHALENIKRSDSIYFLTTTFIERDINVDIQFGGWRPINLQQPPFSFPSPIRLIDEKCPFEDYKDKNLGLWKTTDIPDYR